MPRKSLAKERRAQLLDAFERCIVKNGLEGTSLEQVAEEAGMTRSIIRHYIGNRDALVNALIERIINTYAEQLTAAYDAIPQAEKVSATLRDLFATDADLNPRDKIIIDVLMTAKDRYPRAKKMLVQLFEAIQKSIAEDLKAAYPQASRAQCRCVAYALLCMSETHGSFMWLGMKPRYQGDIEAAAAALLSTLVPA